MRIYEILKKTSPEDVISKIKLHYGDKYIDCLLYTSDAADD